MRTNVAPKYKSVHLTTLGHTHYILQLMSPPMSWNWVQQEKKSGNSALFYFLLRHALKLPPKHVLCRSKTC